MKITYLEYSEMLYELVTAIFDHAPFETCAEKIKAIADIKSGAPKEDFLRFVYDIAETFCEEDCFGKIFDLIKKYGISTGFFGPHGSYRTDIYWLNKYLSADEEHKKKILGYINRDVYSRYRSYEQMFPFLMKGDEALLSRILWNDSNHLFSEDIYAYYMLCKRRTENVALLLRMSNGFDYKRTLMLACEDTEYFYDVVQHEFRPYLPKSAFNTDGTVKSPEELVRYLFDESDIFIKADRLRDLYESLSEESFQRIKKYIPQIELLNGFNISSMAEDGGFAEIVDELSADEIFVYSHAGYPMELRDMKAAAEKLSKHTLYIDEAFIINEKRPAVILRWLRFCSEKNRYIWTRNTEGIFMTKSIPTDIKLAEAYFKAGAVYSECYDTVIGKSAEQRSPAMLNVLCRHADEIENFHLCMKQFPDDNIRNRPEKVGVLIDRP